MRNINNNKKSTKKGNQSSSRNGLSQLKASSTHPPQIDSYEVSHHKTLRFTVTAAVVQQAITYSNLMNTVLIADTATTGSCLFDLIRLKRVRVWGIAAQGTPTSVEVMFITSSTGDATVHTDTSLGVRPAFVEAHPKQNSLASFYQLATGGNCFLLTAPAGSIIDLDLSMITSSGLAPVAAANALVAATVGQVYYRGMDALASATTNFPPPVGIITI